MPEGARAPMLVLALVLALDVWVYVDARRRESSGRPVVFHAGFLVIETPLEWLVGCLLLCILFVPLYMNTRS